MTAQLIVALVKLISGANARWTGCAPEQRQRVYFANHTSHLDAVVVWSVLPPEIRMNTRPVAARDYWTRNRLRLYLAGNIFHSVLIEREKVTAENNPLESLLQALQKGDSLILFPEGTRGNGVDVSPFKSGLYHLARKQPQIELIPVHIDNMNRILPKGEVLPVPLLSCISFGTPMRLQDGETKVDFLKRAQTAVVNLKQL